MKRHSSLPMQISTRYLQLWQSAGSGKICSIFGCWYHPQYMVLSAGLLPGIAEKGERIDLREQMV